MNSLYVALGGAAGSVLRYWLAALVAAKAGQPFWGTLFVNVVGSFTIGLFATIKGGPSDFTRNLVMVGVLGGFTTFSSFSLQTLELFRAGNTELALANIALSLGLCLLGVWLGSLVGRTIS